MWCLTWRPGWKKTARWPWQSLNFTRRLCVNCLRPTRRSTDPSIMLAWAFTGCAASPTTAHWLTQGKLLKYYIQRETPRFLIQLNCLKKGRIYCLTHVLISDRLVSVNEVGWRSFDVTQAVHYWSKSMTKSPLHLEVRIEGERPGSYAAEMAKRVRFTTQNSLDTTAGTPELVLYTLNLEEYG